MPCRVRRYGQKAPCHSVGYLLSIATIGLFLKYRLAELFAESGRHTGVNTAQK
jgi:hypothetical protein